MSTGYLEALALPLDMKEELCRGLLTEFGADRITTRGHELHHRCPLPWHHDRRPSADLNFEKLVFNCLSCGSSGGLLWFIAAARGVSGPAARDWVAQQTGLGGNEFNLDMLLKVLDAVYSPTSTKPPPIPVFSPKVLDQWDLIHPWLTDPFDPADRSWGRGIPEANAQTLRLGYDDEHQRIVIPHFWKDDLVGWQSRRLLDDDSPKYESTGDFPRRSTLYHHDSGARRVVVVESPMSVARHLHHLPMVATFGSAVTDKQVQVLANHQEVIVWYDNDRAGWGTVEGYRDADTKTKVAGLVERLEPYTSVTVVASDWAADPADLDDDTAADLVDQAVPYAAWHRPTTALRCLLCRQCHGGPCSPTEGSP